MIKQKRFLIIVELGRTGFITEYRDSFIEAESFKKELLNLATMFSFAEGEKVLPILEEKGYRSYTINGNQLSFCSRSCITDGRCSINILEVDPATFCIEKLIKERENHSIVFEYEMLTDEFVDRFPHLDLIAN